MGLSAIGRVVLVLSALLGALLPVTCKAADAGKPQYGGTLNIGTVYVTLGVLTWDPADWSWKHNFDTGLAYECLFSADLSKAARNGGRYRFTLADWLPPDAVRGELAESWQWKDNPPRVEVKLRKGVMFPDKPGVMAARELTADDVVASFERLDRSPKKIPDYFSHIAKVEAVDPRTVLFTMNGYSAEWDYRFGWGYYCGIVPKEVSTAGAGNWKSVNGTGPFVLTDVVQGSASTFSRNPNYWDSESVGGQAYKLPYADSIVYRTIKDESSMLTALRTGKLDMLEVVRWSAVPELKKSAPQLQFSRTLTATPTFVVFRVDTKPLNDVRVRRALNMAIDKRELVRSFYGGEAEPLSFPLHMESAGYHEPLEAMPDDVKQLFAYDPRKAKALLAEAGLPDGFALKMQVCSCNPHHMDLAPVLAAYLDKVGVRLEIQPMEFGAYISAMMSRTHAPAYLMQTSNGNPYASMRKNFVTGQTWNPSQYSDPAYDRRMAEVLREPDEAKRQAALRQMQREILSQAPYLFLPTGYSYSAWWPWVKNYGGELRAGADRPGPIHARIWIDQELKRKMGY